MGSPTDLDIFLTCPKSDRSGAAGVSWAFPTFCANFFFPVCLEIKVQMPLKFEHVHPVRVSVMALSHGGNQVPMLVIGSQVHQPSFFHFC